MLIRFVCLFVYCFITREFFFLVFSNCVFVSLNHISLLLKVLATSYCHFIWCHIFQCSRKLVNFSSVASLLLCFLGFLGLSSRKIFHSVCWFKFRTFSHSEWENTKYFQFLQRRLIFYALKERREFPSRVKARLKNWKWRVNQFGDETFHQRSNSL